MFRTRLISGVVLLAITIAVIALGGNFLFAAVLIISMIGMMELYRVVQVHRTFPGVLGYVTGVIFIYCYYLSSSSIK
jgi:phosphatidate cytidylyltransferase